MKLDIVLFIEAGIRPVGDLNIMGCQETDNDDIFFDYLMDSPEFPLLDNLILNPHDTFLSSEVLPIGPPSTLVDRLRGEASSRTHL